MSFVVVRKAVLMEDEGRPEFLKACETREEAEAFAAEYVQRGGGYFKRHDLMIAETTE